MSSTGNSVEPWGTPARGVAADYFDKLRGNSDCEELLKNPLVPDLAKCSLIEIGICRLIITEMFRLLQPKSSVVNGFFCF